MVSTMAAVKRSAADANGYQTTEIGIIPNDWVLKLLPEVCQFRGGKAHEGFVVEGGRYISVNSKFISSDGRIAKHVSQNLCPAKKGDILMVMSDLPNGKALAKTFIVEHDDLYAVNQRVCSLTPYRDEPKFLQYALNRNPYFLKFDDGVSQTHLLNPVFKKCPILLPSSKEEQKAIAEALSDADTLIESLAHLIAKKRAIKQGMAQALLTGNVRLLSSKNEWKLEKLGDYAEFFKGKGLPKSDIAPSGRFSCIHYGELFTTYGAIIKKVHSRTDRIDVALLSKRYDVLMPTSDVTPYGLAKASCLTQENVVIGGDTLVIRTDQTKINGTFLAMQIRYREEQILKLVTGSTVFHLYASDMRKFELPIPPISEQSAIVEALSAIDSDIDGLCSRLAKAQQIKIGMTQVLLTGTARLV